MATLKLKEGFTGPYCIFNGDDHTFIESDPAEVSQDQLDYIMENANAFLFEEKKTRAKRSVMSDVEVTPDVAPE